MNFKNAFATVQAIIFGIVSFVFLSQLLLFDHLISHPTTPILQTIEISFHLSDWLIFNY